MDLLLNKTIIHAWQPWFAELPAGTTVVTPNTRLAEFVQLQYTAWQQNTQQTWLPLKTLSVANWLQEQWFASFHLLQRLLQPQQLSFIWQHIIANSEAGQSLLEITATTKMALEAYRVSELWELPNTVNDSELHTNQQSLDHQTFQQWKSTYQRFCQKHQCIDIHHGLLLMIESADKQFCSSNPPSAETIYLLGFDDIPPRIARFIEQKQAQVTQRNPNNPLSNLPSKLQCVDKQIQQTQIHQLALASPQDEINQLAHWAISMHIRHPDYRIGCVIPGLNNQRQLIEDVFAAHAQTRQLDTQPYNISAGKPLLEYPLIFSALTLLQGLQKPWHYQWLFYLSRCTYVAGYYSEWNERSLLENRLRQGNHSQVSAPYACKLTATTCPILHHLLNKFLQPRVPKSLPLGQWAEFFTQQLRALGWPGDRPLDSHQFQQVKRLQSLWQEYACLDINAEPMNVDQALRHLQQLLTNTVFQSQSLAKPIQVLGSLEAAGLEFDALWIAQMNSQQWPSTPKPNPFLAIDIQKQYRVPNASAEREYAYSQKIAQRLLASGKQVWVSYADEDQGQPMEPSAFIKHLPQLDNKALMLQSFICYSPTSIYHADNLTETIDDLQAPAVSDQERVQLKGGTGLFRDQAACPFRAFAYYRLRTRAQPNIEQGISSLERGNVIHSALELFWQQTRDSQSLHQLSASDYNQRIAEVCQLAMHTVHSQLKHQAPTLYALELTRIKHILRQWLQLELKREGFKVIAMEAALETEFAGIPLRLRMDRIDQLSEGALVLIDYKTGLSSVSSWFSDRPNEPQLPLYALVYPQVIDGLVFGQVKQNYFALKGIVTDSLEVESLTSINQCRSADAPQWQQQKDLWQQHLAHLADEFLTGVATISPKEGTQTCNFCDLQALCRIHTDTLSTHR